MPAAGAVETGVTSQDARQQAAQKIVDAAAARVADPPGTPNVRVEDYLTAVAAVTGEAAIVAAGIDIESLDMTGRTVRVKRGQEPAMTLGVRDPKNLQGLKVGDTVDVTFYESLLVKVARPPKKAPTPASAAVAPFGISTAVERSPV